MNRIAVAVFLMLMIFYSPFCLLPKSAYVEQDGEQVVIQSGQNHLTARLAGKEQTASFLIVGGSGRGIFPFTAHFSVIPMSVADRLTKEHGDFLKCNSSGALEAQRATSFMFLYAQDNAVAQILRAVDQLAKSWKYPVVEMTFSKIDVIAHTTRWIGCGIKVDSSSFQPNFLVKKIRLVEQDFGK